MTAEAAARPRFDHRAARELFGEPDEWEGSVNNPVTREEHGIRFNEKWIYHLPDGSLRLIYWHRYGCRGVLIQGADGQVRPEPI